MLFRNTMAQSASFGLGYLYSFLLAPFMIGRLGLDAFGIWAVTGAFASYAGLLDLGIGMSLSRFVAVYERTIGALARAGTRIDHVDLRYRNGFAARVPGFRERAQKKAAA